MKWDDMSPRERDALVAEKVMGWTDFSPINPDVDYEVGVNGHRRNFAFPPGGKYQPIPHYTTDISAAWEVVQKLKPTHSFELRVGKYAESARFTQQLGVGDGTEFIAQRKHAPESICLSALRAVGVTIE